MIAVRFSLVSFLMPIVYLPARILSSAFRYVFDFFVQAGILNLSGPFWRESQWPKRSQNELRA